MPTFKLPNKIIKHMLTCRRHQWAYNVSVLWSRGDGPSSKYHIKIETHQIDEGGRTAHIIYS